MGTGKLGEQKRFSQKIWLSFSFFSAGSLDPATNGRASRWQRICQPHYQSSKVWQLLPRGWEAVSILVSPLFPADRSPATPIGLDKWPVLGGTCRRQAPDCLLEWMRKVVRRPHKNWPIQVLAPAILFLHWFRCSSLGASFLDVSLPCPVLEEFWEHWDGINSFYLIVWVREEQTRSLFPK